MVGDAVALVGAAVGGLGSGARSDFFFLSDFSFFFDLDSLDFFDFLSSFPDLLFFDFFPDLLELLPENATSLEDLFDLRDFRVRPLLRRFFVL